MHMEKIKPSDEPNQPPPGDLNQPSPGDPNEPPREHIHFARGQFGLVVRHRSNIARARSSGDFKRAGCSESRQTQTSDKNPMGGRVYWRAMTSQSHTSRQSA